MYLEDKCMDMIRSVTRENKNPKRTKGGGRKILFLHWYFLEDTHEASINLVFNFKVKVHWVILILNHMNSEIEIIKIEKKKQIANYLLDKCICIDICMQIQCVYVS